MGQMVGDIFRGMGILAARSPLRGGRTPVSPRKAAAAAMRLRHRADATNARRDGQGVERRAGRKDLLEAAIKRVATRALAKHPSAMSSVNSRSPSTRLNARTMSGHAGGHLPPARALRRRGRLSAFFRTRSGWPIWTAPPGDEPGLRHVQRQAHRNARDLRRDVGVARRLESRRSAGNAGEAGMGAGAAAVPGALVAIADRLGRLAAEMLHQAAAIRQARALALNS